MCEMKVQLGSSETGQRYDVLKLLTGLTDDLRGFLCRLDEE
jgi:hypothetical protein